MIGRVAGLLGVLAAFVLAPAVRADQPVPPGVIVFIRDEPDTPGLPHHFRAMDDPYHAGAPAPLPSRAGLDTLRASGSAQHSAEQLQAVIERVGRPVVLVDLRQESHGFLNGLPVSWYQQHDVVNLNKTLTEIEQDEQARLATLADGSAVTLNVIKSKVDETITEVEPLIISPQSVLTERELARSFGVGYLRIPATDYMPPAAPIVDRFVAFASALPPEVWLHFHCHAGDGRTTSFLAIYDIMRNWREVSAEDVLERQAALGPTDLRHVGSPNSWKYPFAVERARFFQRFHDYVRANADSGYAVPWSVWSALH